MDSNKLLNVLNSLYESIKNYQEAIKMFKDGNNLVWSSAVFNFEKIIQYSILFLMRVDNSNSSKVVDILDDSCKLHKDLEFYKDFISEGSEIIAHCLDMDNLVNYTVKCLEFCHVNEDKFVGLYRVLVKILDDSDKCKEVMSKVQNFK